jgi:TPR repeat protein
MAGPYESATAAYDQGDYATAVMFYRSLALRGDASAQKMLGTMYTLGQGIGKDPVTGKAWLDKAQTQETANQQPQPSLDDHGSDIKIDVAGLLASGAGLQDTYRSQWLKTNADKPRASSGGAVQAVYAN